MSNAVFVLRESLFKDQATFEQVRQFFRESETDIVPVVSDHEIIGAFLSPEAAREVISERVLRRLSEKPELLDELVNRLENDDIVE